MRRRTKRNNRFHTMPILSIDQIVTLAQNAGFSGPDLATAVAVALAESQPPGNSDSYNPEPGAKGGTPPNMGSYGLWQIYLNAHPEFTSVNLFDPAQNAQAAYQVYTKAGQSFRPWTTYTSGKYLAQLPAVVSTIAAMNQNAAPDQTATDGTTTTDGTGTVDATNLLPVLMLGTAGLLVLAGIGGGKK